MENETLASIRRLHLAASRASFELDDLSAGSYTLLIHGQQPLQQFAKKIILGDGDRRAEKLSIEPVPLAARITMGGKPLANGTIAMEHAELGWRGELRTDANGRFAGELWQPGTFRASYRGSDAVSPFLKEVTLRSTPPVAMSLDVASREVRGKIVDRDGLPVPAARVFLRSSMDESDSTIRTQTDSQGVFRFVGVTSGVQRVTVIADGYLSPDPIDFTMREDETSHDVPIRIDAGYTRRLRIVDAEGHPSIGADVLVAIDGEVRSSGIADGEGRVSIATKANASNVIYILGRDGAFAAVRPREDDVMRIALPRPASSLHITTRTTDGKPLGQIALLMSFDGEPIPLDVARRFARTHGMLATDASGEVVLRNLPAGSYQFWPYATEEEAESILAAGLMEAPIAVNVKSGENAIVVDFQAR